ncbi:NAD(P)-dependent oxidoreductase [Parasphingopyxis sp. GrpM-11]|uniref:NAD(P)-dependent oxidoreductase n=2 Tax=Parasphingopyxis marina TaxID=2761622 RepID=A0A842I011_9SPHN|nr:NAD(P)-dependent oxidoreductase [Parasphingopyxis marina]
MAFLGFGEAAMAFAPACHARMNGALRAFDIKTEAPETEQAKHADYERFNIAGAASCAAAMDAAELILSLVTADQALSAATEAARTLPEGALYCDMNSVSPDTKREAADIIEAAGGRYVDVAVMAPVHPKRENVPLLVSGPHAEAALAALKAAGFADVGIAGGEVGRASAIKMIRSIMVKGMEALSAECLIAASRADVREEVINSLTESMPSYDWSGRGDYALNRMMIHGKRRAAEMEEVVKTLKGLGLDGACSQATVDWQGAVGALGLDPADGLAAKIAQIEAERQARGARLA